MDKPKGLGKGMKAMTMVGVYNDEGEPLGVEYVYEDDPADYEDYDYDDRDFYEEDLED